MAAAGADLVDRLTATQTRLWLTVFASLTVIYAMTAHWFGVVNDDSIAAAWPAWQLANHGTLTFPIGADLPDDVQWFQEVDGRIVSNRMPGVILIGVPAQLLFAGADVLPMTPGVLTAVLVTAAAMANIAVVLVRLAGRPRVALGCTVALALGTGMWNNASAELWTHGPDALWLSLAMLALQRDRLWLAGAAFAPAVLTRPHLALVAATVGLVLAARQRDPRVLVRIGLPASVGVIGLLLWNKALYGAVSLSGGYGYPVERVTAGSSSSWVDFASSLSGSLVSPLRGLLLFSPFVLLAADTAIRGLRAAPPWAQGALFGGVVYQLAQARVNGYAGGAGYYSYRLVLELLVLCAPVAYLGYVNWVEQNSSVRRWARILTGVSVAVHVIGVYWYFPFRPGQELDPPPGKTWGLVEAATSRGEAGTALAIVVAAAVVALSLLRLPAPRAGRDGVPGTAAPGGRVEQVSAAAPS